MQQVRKREGSRMRSGFGAICHRKGGGREGESGRHAETGQWELKNQGLHVGYFCLRCLLEAHVEMASGWHFEGRGVVGGGAVQSAHDSRRTNRSPCTRVPDAFGALNTLASGPG